MRPLQLLLGRRSRLMWILDRRDRLGRDDPELARVAADGRHRGPIGKRLARRRGLADLRRLPDQRDAGLGWVVHKSTAVR